MLFILLRIVLELKCDSEHKRIYVCRSDKPSYKMQCFVVEMLLKPNIWVYQFYFIGSTQSNIVI